MIGGMTRRFLAAACLVFACGAARAQAPRRGLGLGLVIGDPTGLTAKHFLDGDHAIDGGLGFSDDFALYGDYLWHGWKAFRQPERGRLAALVGLGLRLETKKRDDALAVRLVGGASWFDSAQPLEVFFELVPALRLAPSTGTDFDFGLGLRWYFTRFN